jgi:transposase
LRFILTGGERNDCTQALALLENIKGKALLADKGYDTNYIVEAAENIGAIVVIPPKKNRIVQREYDKELYKERNIVERLFNKLKNFRRVATRYDKTASAFMGFILLASIIIWLK